MTPCDAHAVAAPRGRPSPAPFRLVRTRPAALHVTTITGFAFTRLGSGNTRPAGEGFRRENRRGCIDTGLLRERGRSTDL